MFSFITKLAMFRADAVLKDLTDGRSVLYEGEGSGSLVNDRELKADTEIGQAVSKVFLEDSRFKYAVVEGGTPNCVFNFKAKDSYVVGIDPIDGSLAYEKARLTAGAPYSLVVTIARARNGEDILFKDIVASLVYDFRVNGYWIRQPNKDGTVGHTMVRSSLRGMLKKAIPDKSTTVDLGKQFVVFESYYPQTRDIAFKAFEGEKGYLRSFCSAAWEMAMVSSGDFSAQFCLSQKNHELGAAYNLVTGAGGSVINAISGESIADEVWMKWTGKLGKQYDWNIQTPVIVACNEAYGKEVYKKIKPYVG